MIQLIFQTDLNKISQSSYRHRSIQKESCLMTMTILIGSKNLVNHSNPDLLSPFQPDSDFKTFGKS